MCGRFSLSQSKVDLEKRFDVKFYNTNLDDELTLPNYNVAPTQNMPIITNENPNFFNIYRWGLIPPWAKDSRIGAKLINARAESLSDTTSFKALINSRRCLIPMDGFYEWKVYRGHKVPYRIVTKNQKIFSVAGLWNSWKNSVNQKIIYSFTIITIQANELVETIHNRMPVILVAEEEKLWLDNKLTKLDVMQLLQQYPSDQMDFFKVSSRVNSVYTNDIDLLKPVNHGDDNTQGQQLELF